MLHRLIVRRNCRIISTKVMLNLKCSLECRTVTTNYNQFTFSKSSGINPNFLGNAEATVEDLFRNYPAVRHVNTKRLLGIVQLLKSVDIDLHEIVSHPVILTFSHKLLRHRYYSLKSLRFRNIGLTELISYPALLRLKMETLQHLGYLEKTSVSEWLSEINLPQVVLDDVNKTMPQSHWKLSEINDMLITNCIRWLLELSHKEAQLYFYRYSFGKLSVQSILESWKLLTTELDFKPATIKANPFLLSATPDEITTMLKRISHLGGMHIVELIHRCPRLLFKPADDILSSWHHLRNFGITGEQLRTLPEVLLLHADTIKNRLKIVSSNSALCKMKDEISFIRLIHEFEIRYHQLKKPNREWPLLTELIRMDSTSDAPLMAISLVSKKLRLSESLISQYLKRHPKYRIAKPRNALNVLDTLQHNGYTAKQIVNAIWLLLYPNDEVSKQLSELRDSPELQPFCLWENKDAQLQCVLYFLERKHNFSSNIVQDLLNN